mgnify:CR=1 FL=1
MFIQLVFLIYFYIIIKKYDNVMYLIYNNYRL